MFHIPGGPSERPHIEVCLSDNGSLYAHNQRERADEAHMSVLGKEKLPVPRLLPDALAQSFQHIALLANSLWHVHEYLRRINSTKEKGTKET